MQVGLDSILWRNGGRFWIEGLGKAGLFYNRAGQFTSFVSSVNDPASIAGGTSTSRAAFVGELGLTGVWQVNDWLALRTGWVAFWLGGLALAPNQLDQQCLICEDRPVTQATDTGGSVFINGLTVATEIGVDESKLHEIPGNEIPERGPAGDEGFVEKAWRFARPGHPVSKQRRKPGRGNKGWHVPVRQGRAHVEWGWHRPAGETLRQKRLKQRRGVLGIEDPIGDLACGDRIARGDGRGKVVSVDDVEFERVDHLGHLDHRAREIIADPVIFVDHGLGDNPPNVVRCDMRPRVQTGDRFTRTKIRNGLTLPSLRPLGKVVLVH